MHENGSSFELTSKEYLLDQICRTCSCKFKSEHLMSIFESSLSTKLLIFQEIEFLKLNISKNDGLPQQICENCCTNFTNLNSFRKTCEKSQIMLKNVFIINDDKHKVSQENHNNNNTNAQIVNAKNLNNLINLNDDDALDKCDENFDCLELEPLVYKNINHNNNIEVLEECEKLLLEESIKAKDDIELLTEIEKYLQINNNNNNNNGLKDESNQILNQTEPTLKSNNQINVINDNNLMIKINDCQSCIAYETINKKLITYKLEDKKSSLLCPLCSRCLKNATALKLHIVAHKNRIKCKIHLKNHYEIKENSIVCHICDENFKDRNQLRYHLNDSHTIINQQKNNSSSLLPTILNDNYKCDHCKKKFANKLNFDKHQMKLHLNQIEISNLSIVSSSSSSLSSISSVSEYKCLICDKICLNKDRFKYHLKTHDAKKRYQCNICDKSFMQRHHLTNHENTHTGIKPYLCSLCGRSFKQELQLNDHMKKHKGFLGYPCKICGKKFTSRSGNFIHMRTHNGKRPYKCDKCKLDFTQSHHLKQHTQTAHEELTIRTVDESSDKLIEINKYKCPFCPKKFRFLTAMSNHTKIHSDENNRIHACPHCDNRFKSSFTLTNHIKNIHLKEKPYGCDICNKKYPNKSDLRIHLRHHTKEKPFECIECKKTFFTSTLLRYHKAVHTGEKNFHCDICGEKFLKNNQLQKHQEKYHTVEEKRKVAEKIYSEIKKTISKTSDNDENDEIMSVELQDLYNEFLNI